MPLVTLALAPRFVLVVGEQLERRFIKLPVDELQVVDVLVVPRNDPRVRIVNPRDVYLSSPSPRMSRQNSQLLIDGQRSRRVVDNQLYYLMMFCGYSLRRILRRNPAGHDKSRLRSHLEKAAAL